MWRFVDMRVIVRLYPEWDQGLIRRLGRHIAEILKAECRCQTEMARIDIENILA